MASKVFVGELNSRKGDATIWSAYRVAEQVIILGLLAIIFWVSRYWRSLHFGLYEDDLTIIPRAVTMSSRELWQFVFSYIIHLYGHARPLSDSFIYVISHYAWKIAGLPTLYWVGYAITLLNIYLFYWLMSRIGSRSLAVSAAFVYCLFSADTTQAFLTHSLGLQPSITMLLVSFHLYLSNRKLLAYLVGFIILFSYETPFLIFLTAPFLVRTWDRKLVKNASLHAVILGVMILSVFLLRSSVADGRVTDLTFPSIILVPLSHMLEGPPVSLATFLYRPYQALRTINIEIAIAILASFFMFVGLLLWQLKGVDRLASSFPRIRLRSVFQGEANEITGPLRTAIVGFGMLILAYPLTFTVRAYAISGRDTRVHFAAVIGAAFVVGGAFTLLITLLGTGKRKIFGVVLFSALLSTLVGYGFVVQKDYVLGWEYQQEFWSQLVPIIPDATQGTIIMVDPSGLKDTRQIGANTWNLPRILNQIYQYPASWKNPPRVYRLMPNWGESILTADKRFSLNVITTTAPASLYGEFDGSNIILISTDGGKLARLTQTPALGGKVYPLKTPSDSVIPGLERGFLYNFLIK